MRLYLVQHGQALPKEADQEQGLTEKGRQDVEKVAFFLRGLNIRVAAVWESGKKRAAQTAEILASSVTSERGTLHVAGLAPLDPVAPIAEKITSLEADYMIVGHLPFLSRLASDLVLGREPAEIVRFQRGGVVCLERGPKGKWTVHWMIVPDLLS